LLTNYYPRLKRRHVTTLKIVCSTDQPWKALGRVRVVKDLFQNCQRDNQSLECNHKRYSDERGNKKNPTKALLSSRREPRRKFIFQNHLYLHRYLEKKNNHGPSLLKQYTQPQTEEKQELRAMPSTRKSYGS